MAKPQLYINVGQVAGILCAAVVGCTYLVEKAKMVDPEKQKRFDREIKQDLDKIMAVFVKPFNPWGF